MFCKILLFLIIDTIVLLSTLACLKSRANAVNNLAFQTLYYVCQRAGLTTLIILFHVKSLKCPPSDEYKVTGLQIISDL